MTFEDSNHRVTLSGNEISSILYIMEGYINPSDDYSYDPDFREDVDNIFEKLEGVADSWEGEFADPKVTNSDKVYPEVEDVPEQVYKEWLTTTDDNYGDKVDSLVDRMKSTKYNSQSQSTSDVVIEDNEVLGRC